MTAKKNNENGRTWENRAMVKAIVAWVTSDLDTEIDSHDDESLDPSSFLTMCETTDTWKREAAGFWEALRDDPTGLWRRVEHPKWPLSTSLYLARERWSDAESYGGRAACWVNAREIAQTIHEPEIAAALDRREIAALYTQADAVFESMMKRLTE